MTLAQRNLITAGFVIALVASILAAQSSHDPDPAPQQHDPQPTQHFQLIAHPVVALTFDDLPGAGNLPPGMTRTQVATNLAAELRKNHLEGTYGFLNAAKMQNSPDAEQVLHAWLDAGMNIGSHTWSHISLTSNTAEAFEHDIDLNEPVLKEFAESRDWHWFRYPFLWEGDTLEKRHAVRSYLNDPATTSRR
jgi:peptidoglycan/xylan/chitin deacetylase (PgdA/CDA1 family)